MSAAIEAAMLEAHRAGLSVIPVRANKRPAVTTWRQFVDTQPDELLVLSWGPSAQGFAVLMGGPMRTQALDFEGRFMEHLDELRSRLGELAPVFESWLDGYFAQTPGGGFHVLVHVEGDELVGNTKLASDGMHQTLVETRGHGGYVVAPPSNGTTHPSGQPWVQVRGGFGTICWATAEQWQSICSIISTFDAVAASETPPEAPPPSALPGGVSLSRLEASSEWIDATGKPPMAAVLEANGWVYDHSDADRSYWVRPDKPPRDGHSASVKNANDRLYMHSSDGYPVPHSPMLGDQTFDSIDVMGCYELGHLPSTSERVEILRRLTGRDQPRIPADAPVEAGDGWLPNDFWEATPALAAIRLAALENFRCPEALLGAVLSAYATTLPPSITVEPIVGGNPSPLNTYVALAGRSGTGKTGAMGLAMAMLGLRDTEDHRFGVSLRSGEGLITAVLVPQPKRKDEVPLTPLYRRGVQVEFDEGKALAQHNDRSGSTMLSYLLSAWSGRGKVGGIKAAGDESFDASMVRICAVMGIQLGVAGSLFTGEAASQGFPGRLLFFGMDGLARHGLEVHDRPIAAPLPLGLPSHSHHQGKEIGVLTFPSAVRLVVRRWDLARLEEGGDVIDGHKMLLRMRTAAVLALMEGNAQVDAVHWELAGEIEKHSLWMRRRLLAGITRAAEERAHAAGRLDAHREQGHLSVTDERLAQRLGRNLARLKGEPANRKQWRGWFKGPERADLDHIVDMAISRDWAAWSVDAATGQLVTGPAWLG
jgi:hypothetical protein